MELAENIYRHKLTSISRKYHTEGQGHHLGHTCTIQIHANDYLSLTYFAPPLIHPFAGFAKKSNNKCGAISTSSLPSFVNIHQAVL